MADILDPKRIFKVLKQAVVDGVTTTFPIESNNRVLRISNVIVDDSKVSPSDYKTQKSVKMKNGDYVAPVYGDLELVDKTTGEVIDRRNKFRLMDVPALTDRYSYIFGGNEYTVDKQLRMKPGIYTREKENGELESQFNMAKGGGRGFRMNMHPEDGIFKLTIGTANPPLYPLLKALGVEDSAIRQHWGEKLFSINQRKTLSKSENAVAKAYKSIFGKDPTSPSQAQVELRKFFDETILSEETTQRTLGKGFAKVTPEALLLTSKRLLDVSRGTAEPDDRDSLVYKHIYDTPDQVVTRIEKSRGKIQRDVRRVMDKKDKITEIVSKDMLNKPVRTFFTQGDVSSASEQTNPTSILANATKVTSLGEGAISDMNAVTDSMRAVNPSHVGVLDPLATPECSPPDTLVYTKRGWQRWDQVSDDDEFLCIPAGVTKEHDADVMFCKAEKIVRAPYSGILYGMDNKAVGYLVTPNHRVLCRPQDYRSSLGYRIETADKVHGRARSFPISHIPVAIEGAAETFSLPKVDGYSEIPPIDIGDWAEFMGWYLSEGSCRITNPNGTMSISQTKSVNGWKYSMIEALLNRLPFGRWHCGPNGFDISCRPLAAYVLQFGDCDQKFIPEEIFSAPIEARIRFMEAMLLGGGRTYSKRKEYSYHQKVYTTTSPKLSEGFCRLATELGYPVTVHVYEDKREERYLPVYEIRLIKAKRAKGNPDRGDYYTQEYSGLVYSAVVPGGLLYIKRPNRLGVWTGNSRKIGVNLHLALGTAIENKEFKTLVTNPTTGVSGFTRLKDMFDKNVAFPDQFDAKGKPVKSSVLVMQAGKIKEVAAKDVDFVLMNPKQMFTYSTNLVPFLANLQGNRGFMAAKMMPQAIPLLNREVPLIQTKMPTGGSFENFVGNAFSVINSKPGKVTAITDDSISVQHADGSFKSYDIYNNFPLNNKSFIHSDVRVKVGDEVKEGTVLADSSYTKDGTLALGTNLRMGILPFRDNTFEDGYVISETAAKKLTSEHLREVSTPSAREDVLNLRTFKAHYPTAINKANSAKLDENGIVKPGTIVEPGDVVIAHLQKVEAMPEDYKLGKLSKSLIKGFRNNQQIWDKETTGRVVDVVRGPDSVKVYIRTEEPMQIGDKIVNRHGAKGIVSKIIPDNEMPHTKDGVPLEVAVSPSAVPGRINPSQILEAAAAKVAIKNGKPLKIDNFAGYDSVDEVGKLLKRNGLTDKEDLIDPTTGQSLGKVMVGTQYYLKLLHQVTKKINARGVGPRYSIDKQPTKGGHTSARAMDRLTWNSLIAHGARNNLFEMTNYKSEDNPGLWNAVRLGQPLPAPTTPFVFNKMLGYLAAGGVNVKKEGNKLFMMPLTDRDILERSNGEIDDAKVVVSKNLRPIQDGLFDEKKTGGLKGTKWTHIALAEPMLNPAMEGAARTVLGLSQKQIDGLMGGTLFYDNTTGAIGADSNLGLTGGAALKQMLSKIDVDKKFDELKAKSISVSGQNLDKINKEMKYLRALKSVGLKPEDAYIVNNVPVLPPQFRPLYPLPNGSLNNAPINYLYRDMILVNRQLKQLGFLDDESKAELRGDLYKALKSLQGLGDPLVARGERKIAGAIDYIKGTQPKEGYFQSTVFSKTQDLSGSSTVTPSVEMSPDEMMLPKDMAWNLYEPFVTRELVRMGYKALDAKVLTQNRDNKALPALEKALRERPIWVNRAPSLHKFSIVALQPKLYEGKSIKVHPLIVGGMNMDFDGDAPGVYVPVTNKAVEEARNYFPSKILEHAADNRIMLKPIHDIMTGLYYLSRDGKDLSANKSYATIDDAMKDYKTKAIEIHDTVMIDGKRTTIGKELLSKQIPSDILLPKGGLTKATIDPFLRELSKKGTDVFRTTMDGLSRLAAKFNIYSSISIGLDDLKPDYKGRDEVVKKTLKELAKAKTDDGRRAVIAKMLPEFDASAKRFLAANPENAVAQLLTASGKPSFDQYKQLISTPFAVSDSEGKAVPAITTKSFAEGLPISEYWTTTYGARTGMIAKRLETEEPGYFSKQILSVTINNVVSMEDCGTQQGVNTALESPLDVVGRYEAGSNRLIDESTYTTLIASGKKSIKLRSPLTCEAKEGICAMCYGLRENGQKAKLGDNVGALAGQFFTEPTTQGVMKSFHTGAVLGAGASMASGLDRLQQLTKVPKFLKDKATLATLEGTINKIEDNPAGGKNIFINGEKHLAGVKNTLNVSVGDRVEKGQALTDGPVKPQEILALKGIEEAQRYLVKSMKDAFKGMGVNMNNKLLETVVRSTTNSTNIEDPGNHPYYVAGDSAPLTEILHWNKGLNNEVDIEDAVGSPISVGVGPYQAGTVMDKDKVKALRTLGIDKVTVRSNPIKHTPSIVGIEVMARLGRDWLSKLNADHIEQTILEGGSQGGKTDITGYNPVPAYVTATEFGKGKGGRY